MEYSQSRKLLWPVVLAVLVLTSAAINVTGTSARATLALISTAPLPSVYTPSTTYTLSVNGTAVPINGYTGYDYAQFSMGSGIAQIVVKKLNGTNVGKALISPMKLGIQATLSHDTATFTLPGPQYLIVKLDDQRQIVITADPAETEQLASSGTGTFNVTSPPYRADSSRGSVTTKAVQDALNDASTFGSQPGHAAGIVYIPRGVYMVGNLELKSNTSVYLEAGAVLRVVPDKSLYRTTDAHKNSQNRDLTWWIYTAFGSRNIKLFGRGTLDGNGMAATKAGFGMNILVPIATSNFTLDGLTIRESASWAVIPVRSNTLQFTNMKIFNRFDMSEDDGIDVIESQNVTVQRGIGISLDDPYSTKSYTKTSGDITVNWPGNPEEVKNVKFDDVISWTVCYGFKVGQGVGDNQDNITFQNSVVYDSAVAIGIDHRAYQAAMTNVTFSNIDIEHIDNGNAGNRTWLAFTIEDQANDGAGPISGIQVKQINICDRGTTAGKLTGFSATSNISKVLFDSIKMPGSTTYATTLTEMNITNQQFVTGVTIKPIPSNQ
jgi:hypothetical protein